MQHGPTSAIGSDTTTAVRRSGAGGGMGIGMQQHLSALADALESAIPALNVVTGTGGTGTQYCTAARLDPVTGCLLGDSDEDDESDIIGVGCGDWEGADRWNCAKLWHEEDPSVVNLSILDEQLRSLSLRIRSGQLDVSLSNDELDRALMRLQLYAAHTQAACWGVKQALSVVMSLLSDIDVGVSHPTSFGILSKTSPDEHK